MKHYKHEISLFVEDELSEDRKRELLLHLSTCDKCRRMLRDYEKIKKNIIQFYKILPDSGNEIKYSPARSSRLSLKALAQKFLVPVSVTAMFIFLLFLLFKIVLRQPKMNFTSDVKKELLSSDYNNISTFNIMINKAIESRKQKIVFDEFRRGDFNNELLDFNDVINSALYNNHND